MEKVLNSKYFIKGLFILAVVISLLCIINIFKNKSEYRTHYKGDIHSELNAYTAGLNFSKWGFAKLYFLPVINTYKAESDFKSEDFYTHYPPGPDIVSGLLTCIGIDDFYTQKASLLLISFLSIYILFLCIKEIYIKQYKTYLSDIGFVFCLMIMTSAWFICWAGNLHQFVYWDLFAGLGILALITNRFILYYLICFVSAFFTFEIIPFLFAFGVFRSLYGVFYEGWSKKKAFKISMYSVISFTLSVVLHLMQNVWQFGSVKLAYNDIMLAFTRRTGVMKTDYSIVKHVVKMFYASLWFYGVGVMFFTFIAIFNNQYKKLKIWGIFLICSSLIWQIVFREHAMVHAFSFRHMGLGIFLLATIGFYELFKSKVYWKCVLSVIILVLVILRIPMGAEISNNKLMLNMFEKVISKTESHNIGEVLCFFKDSPEHRFEKKILLDELTKRENKLEDFDLYNLEINNKKFIQKKVPENYSINLRRIPLGFKPKFYYKTKENDSYDIQAYVTDAGLWRGYIDYSEKNKIDIIVQGKENRIVCAIIKAYILFI